MSCGARRNLEANGLTLALFEWGRAEAPPLLLLHSLAAHSHWWDWAASLWAGRRRVIALDFRGHGASAHAVPAVYAFDDYAADTLAALDALGLAHPVVVGHSMGAYVAAYVASLHPERVRALVIADMLTGWTPEQAEGAKRQAARPAPQFANWAEARDRFKFQPPATRAPGDRIRHLAEASVQQTAPGVWQLAFDRSVFLHPPVNPWPFLPAVVCPTLVIHGEGSTIMDRRAAERVAAAVGRGSVVTLTGTFHHLMLDDPAGFVAVVDGWLTAAH
ncbi:MAG: alpha/beta fold hydrolase [Candidatus Methylomirabilales bacterium]